MDALGIYIAEESYSKKDTTIKFDEWRFEDITDTPLQTNNYDCGVFALMFAEAISRGKEITVKQDQMKQLRNQIIVEIFKGKLF